MTIHEYYSLNRSLFPIAAQKLQEISERIVKPFEWTKGALARDADGNEVEYNDPNATCFCAQGFILVSTMDHNVVEYEYDEEGNGYKYNKNSLQPILEHTLYLEMQEKAVSYGYVPYNDDPARTAEEMQTLFLDAAKRIEGWMKEPITESIEEFNNTNYSWM